MVNYRRHQNVLFTEMCFVMPFQALAKMIVELKFSFGKLGEIFHYRVRRSWILEGKKVKESVRIWDGDEEMRELSQEACEGFLNKLIPVGVSELFFFDGEKIKELAEDKKKFTRLGRKCKVNQLHWKKFQILTMSLRGLHLVLMILKKQS